MLLELILWNLIGVGRNNGKSEEFVALASSQLSPSRTFGVKSQAIVLP
jgi:hypothetical protein